MADRPTEDELQAMLAEELYDRRAKVLFLHNGGATFTQIAKLCEISTTTVRKDLDIAQRNVLNVTPEQRKARQLAVCRDIVRANYAKMMNADDKATASILKALNHEANLIGLYAPAQLLTGVSSVDFAHDAARLIETVMQHDPEAFKELERGQRDRRPVSTDQGLVVIDAETVELADNPRPAGDSGDDRPAQPSECPAAPESADDEPFDDDADWSNIGD